MPATAKKNTGRGRGRPAKAPKEDADSGDEIKITKTIEKPAAPTGEKRGRGRPPGSTKGKKNGKRGRPAKAAKKASSDEESVHSDAEEKVEAPEPMSGEEGAEDKEE